MPFPSTHIDCALGYCKVSGLSGKDKDQFILGNMLPDLKIEGILNREYTHHYEGENYLESNFVENFGFNERERLSDFRNNYLLFGYLFHLITDYSFIINEKKLQKGSINEFMWNFRRKHNSLADKDENPQIIIELANTKQIIQEITETQLPKCFQGIDLKLIKSEYTFMINEIIDNCEDPFKGYFNEKELERKIHNLSKMQSIDNILRLLGANPPSEQNIDQTWNSNLQH